MRKLKPYIIFLTACAVLATLLIGAKGVWGDSLEEIEKDIETLAKKVEKMERDLETLGKTIASPKGGTLVITFNPGVLRGKTYSLKILLNGEEEIRISGGPGGKGNKIYRAYLIPGTYELSVKGKIGGSTLRASAPHRFTIERDGSVTITITPVKDRKKGSYNIFVTSK